MRRIAYILLGAWMLISACQKLEPVTIDAPAENPELSKDVKVPISFDVLVPRDKMSTRAMADEPEIDHIRVAVFGGSGFFNEWLVATIQDAQEVNYDGTEATKYTISINLTMTDSRLRLHFIANGPEEAPLTGQPSRDNEDGMMSRLTSKLNDTHNDGYWQKVVLPLGVHAQTWFNDETQMVEYYKVNGQYVPTVETVEQFPDPIKLIRNFARIRVKLADDSQLTSISSYALANVPIEGSFAPMIPSSIFTDEYGHYDENGSYSESFVPNYSDLTFEQLTSDPYNYGGYFPSGIQLGGYWDGEQIRPYPNESDMKDWSADKYLYVYERTIPTTTRPSTRLIIKATHQTDGEKYYRVDLRDKSGSYALLRNHSYLVTIGDVAAGTGKDTPKEAYESASADVSAEVTDLPEVSDGIAQIAVEYIEKTYIIGGETYTVDFQFIPDIGPNNQGTPDNNKVTFKLGAGVGNEFKELSQLQSDYQPAITNVSISSSADGKPGWGRITYTLTANNVNKYETIRVIGTKEDGSEIYRDVVIYLKVKQVMTVQCLDKYIEEEVGATERVRVIIPGDLSRSMFPLDFKIEPASYALNPDGQNMPVQSGTSLTGSGKPVFYFIRTITWEEYRDVLTKLSDTDPRKYFDCKFKSTKAESECYVWVSNPYFLNGSDETTSNPGSGNKDNFFNYTQREFSNLMFSGRVEEDQDVDFRFEMDPADLPTEVTVRLNGLEPREGETRLHRVEGENDVYLYYPGGRSSATLRLTASAEDYSVTLTTETETNPLHYAEASRTKSDPAPSVTNITVTPATSTVAIGNYTTLTATLQGQMTNQVPVTWTSSNPAVATVDESGHVTGVAVGDVTITASAGGKEATATVKVVNTSTVTINSPAVNNDDDYWDVRTWTSDPVSVVFSSAARRRTGNYYNRYYYTYVNDNSTVTVSTTTNKRIVGITIHYLHNNNSVTTNSGDYSESGDKLTGTWTGSATSVRFSYGRDNSDYYTRISSIEVEYEN